MKVCFITLKHDDAEQKRGRMERVKKIISENPENDLYMLPEMWNTGFFSVSEYKKNAEKLDGETITALSECAARLNSYIFCGSIIEKRGSKLYNTAVLLDRRGSVCGKYEKNHLFGAEKEIITAGDKMCVCDTEFGRAGISVCYDLRFPEQYRGMVKDGAEMFLNCAAWPKSRIGHWEILTQARAVENQAVCLSVCAGGKNCGTAFAGESLAVSARGEMLLKTDAECDSVCVDINDTAKYRAEFPVLCDMR